MTVIRKIGVPLWFTVTIAVCWVVSLTLLAAVTWGLVLIIGMTPK